MEDPTSSSMTSSTELQSFKQPSTHRSDSYMQFSTFISNMVETFWTLGLKDDTNSTIYVQFASANCNTTSSVSGHSTSPPRTPTRLISSPSCDHLPPMQPQQRTLDSSDRQQIEPDFDTPTDADHQSTSLH